MLQTPIRTRFLRSTLDLIILKLLSEQLMYGYQIITTFRRNFGTYFSPSTIYPLLGDLEKAGFIKSEWNLSNDRPRKLYQLTAMGHNTLRRLEADIQPLTVKMESLCR